MKRELENFFAMSFDSLLQKQNEFTMIETSQTNSLSLGAMVYFNLAKMGWDENDEGYNEARKDELEYLGGLQFS